MLQTIFLRWISSQKALMRVYIHPPDTSGARDIGMAWGWTVYCVTGVWRCLYEDSSETCPRAFCIVASGSHEGDRWGQRIFPVGGGDVGV